MEVVISGLACAAGSKKLLARKKAKLPQEEDPAKKRSFFGKNTELNGALAPPMTDSLLEKTFSVGYTVYSAEVVSTPPHEMIYGIESATKKKPPKNFLFEAVHVRPYIFWAENFELKIDSSQ